MYLFWLHWTGSVSIPQFNHSPDPCMVVTAISCVVLPPGGCKWLTPFVLCCRDLHSVSSVLDWVNRLNACFQRAGRRLDCLERSDSTGLWPQSRFCRWVCLFHRISTMATANSKRSYWLLNKQEMSSSIAWIKNNNAKFYQGAYHGIDMHTV
jgi:hypothetical protein